MMPTITLIILNWNNWKDTVECLESVYNINYPEFKVIVVDNGSEDESIEKIKEYCEGKLKVKSKFFKYNPESKTIDIQEYPKESSSPNNPQQLIIIANDDNYGFAGGNNIGMKFVLDNIPSEYVLLLNNDTVVDKDLLNHLVEPVLEDPAIGFVGPAVLYYDYKGSKNTINFAGGKYNPWTGHVSHMELKKEYTSNLKSKYVDYLEASCVLVKTEMIKKIGMLNTQYFLYWEDNEWCMRGLRAGYKCYFQSKAKIWHKISVSSPHHNKIYYMGRNKFWFIKEYSTKLQLVLSVIYFIFLEFIPFSFYYGVYTAWYPEFIKCYFKGAIKGLKTNQKE
ncbi:glycosyltransferase family 2 protein [Methanobacterium alcaliphilum]|uniref:glycosyltransferase family 2 protein n=1 Tax=Methanobacterium alcaliphilum TaxID=392018 RepID=UPI00200A725B|nr:glycosyltransferase family 2 protein [Methanobacterium alcaliphilum]MCK9150785.1 glycosyltransferase family 2 protein [Methanobacterium alcaliphilum]